MRRPAPVSTTPLPMLRVVRLFLDAKPVQCAIIWVDPYGPQGPSIQDAIDAYGDIVILEGHTVDRQFPDWIWLPVPDAKVFLENYRQGFETGRVQAGLIQAGDPPFLTFAEQWQRVEACLQALQRERAVALAASGN